MSKNVTDKTQETHSHDYLWSSIVVAVLSPVAVVGNGLVLVAIWRNASLKTPTYILLAGLAFTDFCTGFISQPFYVTHNNMHSTWRTVYVAVSVAGECFIHYFFILTVFIITLMSIERWLHMNRRSLVTVRRACVAIAMLLPLPIPIVVLRLLYYGKSKTAVDVAIISLLLFCLTVTSVAYYNVFRIIRRHQHQVQISTLSQSTVQPAINFAKYKKSVFTILYVVAIFYAGYSPLAIAMALIILYRPNEWNILVLNVSIVLTFLSSSLNPLLYLWRMKDIRNEVAQLVKGILFKHNAN